MDQSNEELSLEQIVTRYSDHIELKIWDVSLNYNFNSGDSERVDRLYEMLEVQKKFRNITTEDVLTKARCVGIGGK